MTEPTEKLVALMGDALKILETWRNMYGLYINQDISTLRAGFEEVKKELINLKTMKMGPFKITVKDGRGRVVNEFPAKPGEYDFHEALVESYGAPGIADGEYDSNQITLQWHAKQGACRWVPLSNNDAKIAHHSGVEVRGFWVMRATMVYKKINLKTNMETEQILARPNKGSVLLPWTEEITFMQQSVLIAAVRGPDGIRKDHPVKVLCRWLRRSILKSAMDGKELATPYEVGGGSFTGPCKTEDVKNLSHAMELYFRHVDELPHHFQLHLMHAAEILGYKHPTEWTRNWWNKFYLSCVNDLHLFPETEELMDLRLGDTVEGWRAREVVIAK